MLSWIARDEPFRPICVLRAQHREAQLPVPNESGYLGAGPTGASYRVSPGSWPRFAQIAD